MITDEIEGWLQAEPFRPIRIGLGNQQMLVVAHTDYLMISPDRQTVVLYDEAGHFHVVNASPIRLVEPVQASSSKGP